jgi:hypothetical protein
MLQPQQPSSRRRLVLYGLVAAVLATATILPWYAEALRARVRENMWQRASFTAAYKARGSAVWLGDKPSLQALLDLRFPLWGNAHLYLQGLETLASPHGEGGENAILLLSAWVAWPWASVGVFLLLRSSMRAARLRPEHALRVTLYSFDAMALAAVVFPPIYGVYLVHDRLTLGFASWFPDATPAIAWTCVIAFAVALVRMHVACRSYLRLPHATAVLAASQVIALLLTLAVLQRLPWGRAPLFEMMNQLVRSVRRW